MDCWHFSHPKQSDKCEQRLAYNYEHPAYLVYQFIPQMHSAHPAPSTLCTPRIPCSPAQCAHLHTLHVLTLYALHSHSTPCTSCTPTHLHPTSCTSYRLYTFSTSCMLHIPWCLYSEQHTHPVLCTLSPPCTSCSPCNQHTLHLVLFTLC